MELKLTGDIELDKALVYIDSLHKMLDMANTDRARLRFWLGEIIRFYEQGSPVEAHQFSLREAKKLLL